jgi:hypothetical protein
MTPKRCLLLAATLLLVAIPCAGLFAIPVSALTKLAMAGLVGMALTRGLLAKDQGLQVTKALPNGATTIYTAGIDLGVGTSGSVPAHAELLIEAPLLAFADLGDAATMKYEVQHDTDSAFGTAVSLYGTVLTQTGAGGVGAAAATKRVRLPSDCSRYIRVAATNSAGGDASDKTLTVTLLV